MCDNQNRTFANRNLLWYREAEHQEQMYDSLVQLVEDSETEPAEPIIYSEDKTILPELTELYRQNNDLVGWICVEDKDDDQDCA